MKTTTRIASLLSLVAVCLLGLAGCDETAAEAAARDKEHQASVGVTPVKMGQPFELEGCQVQAYRVRVTGQYAGPDFTTATTKCPTATVVATSNNCGKGCNSEALIIQPAAPATSAASGKTTDAQRYAELRARVDALAQEVEAGSAADKRRYDELHARVVDVVRALDAETAKPAADSKKS